MQANLDPRYVMWCRLIPDYAKMAPETRHNLKRGQFMLHGSLQHIQPNEEDIRKAKTGMLDVYDGGSININSIPCINTQERISVQECVERFSPFVNGQLNLLVEQKETPKGNDMYDDDFDCDCDCDGGCDSAPYNETKAQKSYLFNKLNDANYKKSSALETAFGLVSDPAPNTAQKLVDRILAGKYVLSDTYKDEEVWTPSQYITWRDPSVKKDKDGFDAAMKEVDVKKTDAKDAIMVGTPAEGLAAVKAFEAWMPAGVPN